MKKFILLLLILPLTLMARPEKKWLQIPTSGMVAYVKWDSTTNCEWSNGAGATWTSYIADDDCDNNARTIQGIWNSTDGTCTDGGAGGCDGAFPRLTLTDMPKGYYSFVFEGFIFDNSGSCLWRFYDGTNFTNHVVTGNAGAYVGTLSMSYYNPSLRKNVTWDLQNYELASSSCIITTTTTPRELVFKVYYYPEDPRYIITK